MKCKKSLFSIIIFLLLPLCVIKAAASSTQPYLTRLSKAFDFKAYQQCQSLIHQCPKQGPFIDETCATKTAQSHVICQQSMQLSQAVGSSIAQLNITSAAQFQIVEVTFPADGQADYYLLTPQGNLINTIIDLSKIDLKLAEQAKTTHFLIMNWGK